MGLLENLLEDHQKLRSLAAAMVKLVHEKGSPGERLDRTSSKRLSEMEEALTAGLKAHEELEARFLEEILLVAQSEVQPLVRTIRADHDALRDIFQILSTVTDPESEADAYSIRFALASLVSQLERHLSFEEKETFPLLRRLLSPALLESLGARVASLPGPAATVNAER